MATYTTYFSEYTIGNSLSDWSDYWSVGGITYLAEANSGTYKVGTKQVDFVATTAGDKSLTWDDIGSVSDVDVLAKVKTGSASPSLQILARVSGAYAARNSYYFLLWSGGASIGKKVAGAGSALLSKTFVVYSDIEYWVRFRVNGTNLKARIWAVDAVEPNDWLLETTDSDLSSGHCGLGHVSAKNFKCDFFECVTGGGIATYPPASWNYDTAFRKIYHTTGSSIGVNWSIAMSGQFIDTSRKLTGVGVYCVTHNDDIRVAVYTGGSLATGPAGATLLKDFGKTSGALTGDYVNIFTTDDIDVPSATPIWIVIKGNNSTGFYNAYITDPDYAGDFQQATGRFVTTTHISSDPDVAYPSTFPSGSGSFANYWFRTKIYLDGYIDAPTTTSTSTSSTSTTSTSTTTSSSTTTTTVTATTTTTVTGSTTTTSSSTTTTTTQPYQHTIFIMS